MAHTKQKQHFKNKLYVKKPFTDTTPEYDQYLILIAIRSLYLASPLFHIVFQEAHVPYAQHNRGHQPERGPCQPGRLLHPHVRYHPGVGQHHARLVWRQDRGGKHDCRGAQTLV